MKFSGLEGKNLKNSVPAVFKLIEGKAPTQEIVQQLLADSNDPEKLFLAIDELQIRGAEGAAAISHLATSTNFLGNIFKKVKEQRARGGQLEAILGMNRIPNMIHKEDSRDENFLKRVYSHARTKGYTKLSLQECLKIGDSIRNDFRSSHLTGRVDEEFITLNSTFAVDEAGYLELLGPKEILRLRSLEQPKFLLLGSYGVYSAREFKSYVKKINPQAQSFVIDIDSVSIDRLRRDEANKGTLVQADARELPFKEGTMDHIYTNKLFGFLGFESESGQYRPGDVKKVLQEAFLALKSGGSLILSEYPPGGTTDPDTLKAFFEILLTFARQIGFEVDKINLECLTFTIRKEVGSSTIDANGFPQYGDSILLKNRSFLPFNLKLLKP